MKLLVLVLCVFVLGGCAWMVGTVDDQGRIIDGNGNFVGYARHDTFGGRSATCSTYRNGPNSFTARCW